MDPAVLLMDEPFASLDAQTRTLLHKQLQEIWIQSHKTILFVTHSVGEAVRLADRIIVLHSHPGRIRCEVPIPLPHPRDVDTRDIAGLAHRVRREIEDEVNRINLQLAGDDWKPAPPVDLGASAAGLGDGI
jgi:NitT/TauT family transport system ATP-binding protein